MRKQCSERSVLSGDSHTISTGQHRELQLCALLVACLHRSTREHSRAITQVHIGTGTAKSHNALSTACAAKGSAFTHPPALVGTSLQAQQILLPSQGLLAPCGIAPGSGTAQPWHCPVVWMCAMHRGMEGHEACGDQLLRVRRGADEAVVVLVTALQQHPTKLLAAPTTCMHPPRTSANSMAAV